MHSQVEDLPGVILSRKSKVFDSRGWFLPALALSDPKADWILQNISYSEPGVLRGLHYQDPFPQAKLLTLVNGTIQDIIADLRPHSPTYGCYAVYFLDGESNNQL